MASVFEVAEWFLQKEPMSHKKLQKMCYYAHAWSCALSKEPLITDSVFEAWVHGPVSAPLYHRYKGNGWDPIHPDGWDLNFSEEELDLLESVYATYGGLSANELEVLSHNELPWKIARGPCVANARCENPLNNEDMKTFYLSIYQGDDA